MVHNCSYELEDHEIKISNVNDYDTVTYSLFLIKGYIAAKSCNEQKVQIEYGTTVTRTKSELTLNDGLFKSIVELNMGANTIKIQYCKNVHSLTLNYIPKQTIFRIIPLYIICKGHDGIFQAPASEPNSIDSALNRISIGTRLIQTLFAEKLYESGLGRKTFQIEYELDATVPKCRTFYSQLDAETARSMNEYELWKYFGTELMNSELGRTSYKFLAFLSCTRYNGAKYNETNIKTHDDIVSLTEAHAALGGGGLALFGTGCLHTWASSVGEIEQKFLDTTPVDKSKLMDDSCYRGTYGACFSTTLGSVCHELGHTFDLGHTETGIMDRGFDHIDLFFISRPPSDTNKVRPTLIQHTTVDFQRNIDVTLTINHDDKIPDKIPETHEEDGLKKYCHVARLKSFNSMDECVKMKNDRTFLTKNCALILFYHRWFNESTRDEASPLEYVVENREIVSASDIKVVEIREEATGLVLEWWEIKESRRQFVIPEYLLEKHKNFVLFAENCDGDILRHTISN